jgi:single-stranded DNA-binding protein
MAIEVAFFGSLGRPAEQKISKSGKPYLRLNIRVGDGDAAQWVAVLTFDEDAIADVDRFTKGARIYVEGRLTLNSWTGQDGAERHGLNDSVLAMPFGGNRQKQAPAKAGARAAQQNRSTCKRLS